MPSTPTKYYCTVRIVKCLALLKHPTATNIPPSIPPGAIAKQKHAFRHTLHTSLDAHSLERIIAPIIAIPYLARGYAPASTPCAACSTDAQ